MALTVLDVEKLIADCKCFSCVKQNNSEIIKLEEKEGFFFAWMIKWLSEIDLYI